MNNLKKYIKMEETETGDSIDINIKEIEINEGDNKYKCQIQTNKEYIYVSLYNNDILKHKGNIHISYIQYNLGIYNFNIDDIFDEISRLNNNKFNIIKDINN